MDQFFIRLVTYFEFSFKIEEILYKILNEDLHSHCIIEMTGSVTGIFLYMGVLVKNQCNYSIS